MDSEFRVFGDGPDGQIEANLFADGDLVVCHGSRGLCENIADVSGHAPIINTCDKLGIPLETENEIIQFVHDNTEVYDDGDQDE